MGNGAGRSILQGSKDLVAVLRDGGLVALFLGLVFAPEFVRGHLTRAGFTKGTIAGLEWQAASDLAPDYKRLTDQLKAAAAELVRQKTAVAQMKLQLEQAGAQAQNPAVRASLSRLAERAGDQQASASAAAASAGSTLRATRDSAGVAEQVLLLSAPYVVVVGADKTLAAARDEVRRADRAGLNGATLIWRSGVYRTVLPAASEPAADRLLTVAKTAMRDDAYVRELKSWCPALQVRPDFAECSAG